MIISEYSIKRARALTKLNIPEAEMPANFKILWFDIMTANEISAEHVSLESHSHSFFELLFTVSGKMAYECDGKLFELSPEKATLLPPGVSHKCINYNEDTLKASIAFSLDNSDILSAKLCTLSAASTQNVHYILKNIENKNFLIPAIIGGRICEILFSVFDSLQIPLPLIEKKNTDTRVAVAKSFIDKNKNRIIRTEDVAKECCLSAKQLNRIFKSCAGCSLSEYIANVKIKYSKWLLLNSQYSVKEISFMLGFESECSFVSFFKRHCGMPPGSFKASHKKYNKM